MCYLNVLQNALSVNKGINQTIFPTDLCHTFCVTSIPYCNTTYYVTALSALLPDASHINRQYLFFCFFLYL